jgi:hypothetical protein
MSIATIIMSTTIITMADLVDIMAGTIMVVDIMAGIIKRQCNTADIL